MQHLFRLRSLLLIAILAAICFVAFKPLAPTIVVESIVPVPGTKPYSNFPGRFRQFRLTVRNIGMLPLWLSPNDLPISDDSWLAKGESAYVAITGYNDRSKYMKLAAGESRVYDLLVHAEYEHFRLFVDVRDWRRRDAYKFLGLHSTEPNTGGERDAATEHEGK